MFDKLYSKLLDKYGDDFNWAKISEAGSFLDEVNSELNDTHPLFEKVVKAVAKCEANDDVLFLLNDSSWVIVHLTYSKNNEKGFPIYKSFSDLLSAMKYIEEQFVLGFM
jgi:hypothetical protein